MNEYRPSCSLDEYGVAFIKNGRRLATAKAKPTEVNWSRVLDDVSDASVTLKTAGEGCCGELSKVDHWNTEMLVFVRNKQNDEQQIVWRGPCMIPEYDRDQVVVTALDHLVWLQNRIIELDQTFTNEDVSDIFIAIATYAYTKDPTYTPPYEFMRYATGQTQDRQVSADQLRMTWSVAQELLSQGLDVTTYGKRILVGRPDFKPVRLRDTDVIGKPNVQKDGKSFTNRVVGNASRDIVGIYPPGPPGGQFGYPLIESVLSDTQIIDQPSADAAVKERYTFAAKGVRRVDSDGPLILRPTSSINPRTLLAGQLFNYSADETCYSATETLRLGKLSVKVTAGREVAQIDLQPVGGTATDA